MDLFRWDPREDLPRLRDELNRFFDLPARFFGRDWGWWPAIDVYETEDAVVVKADLPGVAPGDLDVRVTEEAVTIRGRMQADREEEGQGFYRRERRAGSFHRIVPLPAAVRPEETRATFRHGTLEVRAPKADAGRGRGFRVNVEEVQ